MRGEGGRGVDEKRGEDEKGEINEQMRGKWVRG